MISLKESAMRVLIFGAGAVGLGLGSCMLKSDVELTLVGNHTTVSALRACGLSRTGIFGDFHANPESFTCDIDLDCLSKGNHDYVLVCTKSFDSESAARALSQHTALFHRNTKIVLCQNGWGNAEIFASFFSENQIYNARIITGFSCTKPNEVAVTVHADAIHVGSQYGASPQNVRALCAAIENGDIPCAATSEIGKDLWAKMLYNCALNPLGAILGVPYGELGESPDTRGVMEGIVREGVDVMLAAGYETHWASPDSFLKAFYSSQLPETAAHESSMLQDIRRQKPTEIDALNGAVIKIGEQHNMPTPFNTTVCALVRFIEASHRRG